jgi:mannose-1-phosphate guanylyltransferase
MGKCVINDSAYVEGSIIGWKSKIGRWARLDGLCVLGEDVTVSDEVHLASQTIILPNVTVKNNTKSGSTILC